MNDIAERVVQIVAKIVEIDPKSVTLESAFTDIGISSLDALELIFKIEEEFDVRIPDDAASRFRTVGDVIKELQAVMEGSSRDKNKSA